MVLINSGPRTEFNDYFSLIKKLVKTLRELTEKLLLFLWVIKEKDREYGLIRSGPQTEYNIERSLKLRPSTFHLSYHRTMHSDSKWLKLARNKFNLSDFTSFFKQDSADWHNFHYRSLQPIHFEICQTVAGIRMIVSASQKNVRLYLILS